MRNKPRCIPECIGACNLHGSIGIVDCDYRSRTQLNFLLRMSETAGLKLATSVASIPMPLYFKHLQDRENIASNRKSTKPGQFWGCTMDCNPSAGDPPALRFP